MDFRPNALHEEGYMSEVPIRILIADDQKLFAENLKTVIETRAQDMRVVGIACDGDEAVRMSRDYRPDVILMDVCMPRMDGVKAIREISRELPRIKVLVLTTFGDDDYVLEALKYGAAGYLLKDISMPELIQTVRNVSAGMVSISPEVASSLARNLSSLRDAEKNDPSGERPVPAWIDTLNRRERQILKLIAEGIPNADIGEKLFIGDQTVKNYVSAIYDKTGIHDRITLMKEVEPWKRLLGDW